MGHRQDRAPGGQDRPSERRAKRASLTLSIAAVASSSRSTSYSPWPSALVTAAVLLLDEATAAIDSVNDAAFRAALRRSVLPAGCAS